MPTNDTESNALLLESLQVLDAFIRKFDARLTKLEKRIDVFLGSTSTE